MAREVKASLSVTAGTYYSVLQHNARDHNVHHFQPRNELEYLPPQTQCEVWEDFFPYSEAKQKDRRQTSHYLWLGGQSL